MARWHFNTVIDPFMAANPIGEFSVFLHPSDARQIGKRQINSLFIGVTSLNIETSHSGKVGKKIANKAAASITMAKVMYP